MACWLSSLNHPAGENMALEARCHKKAGDRDVSRIFDATPAPTHHHTAAQRLAPFAGAGGHFKCPDFYLGKKKIH